MTIVFPKMRSTIAITLALLGCIHSSASAKVVTSPSVKYSASPVKEINGKRISKHIKLQEVQLKAAAGLSSESIQAINQELISVVKEFKRSADRCHSAAAQGNLWGYESKIEKIVLTKKYISFVFARFTVCAWSPDFEKDPIVFSTNDGKVVSAKALYESSFPGRTGPEVRDYDKRLIGLNAEMAAALLHDSKIALKDYDESCEFHLRGTSYKFWPEGKSIVFVPEFSQAESNCQKEYVINLSHAATPGIRYDQKKRTISLTANGRTVVLERIHKNEGPELVGAEDYIRILPPELQPYRDQGILLLNTTIRSSSGDGSGQ